jgi:hypothetical protein
MLMETSITLMQGEQETLEEFWCRIRLDCRYKFPLDGTYNGKWALVGGQ